MRIRKPNLSFSEKRLLSRREGADYVGIGLSAFRTWSDEIGAVRRFGNRVLFDRNVIDAALDKLNTNT